MAKKKPPKEQPPGPPSLGDLPTKDLLRSIRDELAELAKRAELDQSPRPPKPPRSR